MALFIECMPSCVQIVLDTADIVRDGDFATPKSSATCVEDHCKSSPRECRLAVSSGD